MGLRYAFRVYLRDENGVQYRVEGLAENEADAREQAARSWPTMVILRVERV